MPSRLPSAFDPTKPAGEHIEGMGVTPVHALLALARQLHLHRPVTRGPMPRPTKVHEPGGYRSPALDGITLFGD